MARVNLLPDEKVLVITRSLQSLATFYATDRRLIRRDWRPWRRRTDELPYSKVTGISSAKRRNLSLVALGIVLSLPGSLQSAFATANLITYYSSLPADILIALLVPFWPLPLVVVGIWGRTVSRIRTEAGPSEPPGLWEVWGSGGKKMAELVRKQMDQTPESQNVLRPAALSYPIGPEERTLFEKIVGLIHLPYLAGSAIFVALPLALTLALPFLVLPGLGVGEYLVVILGSSLGIQIAFYSLGYFTSFVMIRRIRNRLVAAEKQLVGICSEDSFHSSFRRLLHPLGPSLTLFVFTVGTFTLSTLYSLSVASPVQNTQFHSVRHGSGSSSLEMLPPFDESPNLLLLAASAFSVSLLSIFSQLTIFGTATFLWVYLYSQKGLYNLGSGPLKFRHPIEDRMFGVHVFGSLSLSLALSYFVVLFGFLVGDVLVPQGFLSQLPIDVTMIAVGLAAFFFPLRAIHVKMLKEKRSESKLLNDKERELSAEKDSAKFVPEWQRIQEIKKVVDSSHTWPIDARILGRLVGVIITFWSLFNLTKYILGVLGYPLVPP